MTSIPGPWGFTGSQSRRHAQQIQAVVAELVKHRPPTELHHGDCIGADEQIHHQILNFPRIITHIVIHPPAISTKRAWCNGPRERVTILDPMSYISRNHAIVDDTYGLIAAPKMFLEELRSGTWATIRYARALERPLIIVWPDGSVKYERYEP